MTVYAQQPSAGAGRGLDSCLPALADTYPSDICGKIRGVEVTLRKAEHE